jgi:hypothetical protein
MATAPSVEATLEAALDPDLEVSLFPPDVGIRPRRRVRLAILGLFLLSMLALVAAFVLWAGQRFEPPPVRFVRGPAAMLAEAFVIVAYGALGALLARYEPRNRIGWLFLLIGLTTAGQLLVSMLVADALEVLRPVPGIIHLAAWAASSFTLPLAAALLVFVFLLFPDGHTPGPRWRLAGWASTAGAALLSATVALSPEGLIWYPSLANPLGAPDSWKPAMDGIGLVGVLGLMGGLFAAAASMVVRYRSSEPIRRLQLRWIAYAVVATTVIGAPFLFVRYVTSMSDDAGEWFLVAMVVAAALMPISAAIAILRHRLFDIDKLINRTIVYVPLTAILAGLYAASVSLFQRVFVALTGDTSDAVIVLTTLILASAFTPVRKSLEGLADRYLKPEVAAHSVAHEAAHQAAHELVGVPAGALDAPDGDADLVALVHSLATRLEVLERGHDASAEGGAIARAAVEPGQLGG